MKIYTPPRESANPADSKARWAPRALVLAVTVALFSSVTMRTLLLDYDGFALNAYGFPFPWHRWARFSSLHRYVDVVALVADFAVYLAVTTAIFAALRPRVPFLRSPPRWLTLLLSALAAASLGLLTLNLYEVHAQSFNADNDYHPVSRHPHVGWSFPY